MVGKLLMALALVCALMFGAWAASSSDRVPGLRQTLQPWFCVDGYSSCSQSDSMACGSVCWGAIATSPSTGKYGYHYNAATQAEAETVAVKNCGATDCAVRGSFDDGCGAVAHVPGEPGV